MRSRVTDFIWNQKAVPPPLAVAEFIESDPELSTLLADEAGRLKAWDPDKPYPLLPTKLDLADAACGKFDRRWLVPGTERGSR